MFLHVYNRVSWGQEYLRHDSAFSLSLWRIRCCNNSDYLAEELSWVSPSKSSTLFCLSLFIFRRQGLPSYCVLRLPDLPRWPRLSLESLFLSACSDGRCVPPHPVLRWFFPQCFFLEYPLSILWQIHTCTQCLLVKPSSAVLLSLTPGVALSTSQPFLFCFILHGYYVSHCEIMYLSYYSWTYLLILISYSSVITLCKNSCQIFFLILIYVY